MMRRVSHSMLAVALLTALPSFATVVVRLSLEELTQRTPMIVRGTVHRTEAGWDRDHRRIWTWTEVVVKSALKGRASATILVKHPGGQVGELRQSVSGAPTFTTGEDVVLFLEPAVDEKGAFVLMGLSTGKVTIEETLGVRVARRNLKGLAFARPAGAGLTAPVKDDELLGTEASFLARVRAAVDLGGAK